MTSSRLVCFSSVENGLFGVALSVVLIVLIAAVRRGVARADSAQQAALDGYGRTRLDEATESHRDLLARHLGAEIIAEEDADA